MGRNELGDIRRSQVITTHGPGAIIDFRAGGAGGAAISVVSGGLEAWDERARPAGLQHPQTIFEPRLQKQLEVDGFRLPPVAPQVAPGAYAPSAGSLSGVRFPQWLHCPRCHLLRQPNGWREAPGDPALFCEPCSGGMAAADRVHVVPVRFIVVCPFGHLDEFPWHSWVRHREGCSLGALALAGSATAGLAGYILSCRNCGASRSMEGCFGDDVAGQCRGKRPWLPGDHEDCPGRDDPNSQPRVTQRGASNLYFSVVESALDIPPWSDALQARLVQFWPTLLRAADAPARGLFVDMLGLPAQLAMTRERLIAEIEARIERIQAPHPNLRWEEYEQLTKHEHDFQTTEFEVRPTPPPPELRPWVDQVVRVTRLREVRALRGFTRVLPPTGPEDPRIAPISVKATNWLPAIENRGEGIFLRLDATRLRQWETSPAVEARAATINEAFGAEWRRRGGEGAPPRTIRPRFLLVHTLAHALIRQLSLDCGYSSASLRERIYADVDSFEMAGLLIFTASPDADGTLGGLVRQGEPAMLAQIVDQALRNMSWCSSDPLCIEGVHTITDSLSGAACHCCLLGAETSCEEFNRLLDRALLIGTPHEPALGYFTDYLTSEV
ncbi:MAG: DUF1998 domain-containing protein [Deltaproteobacteria bacterium]|nr:DUF1998 domain-containing protein [Deltaproteobacteria bacterium]